MTLFEAVSTTLRRLHYSPRTEEAYLAWVRAFVRFHNRRHPRDLGAAEITAFLNDLAVRQRTSASTQNQALCALVFLYRKVLAVDMPALDGLQRARRPEHLPIVLSRPAVRALLDQLHPPFRLLGELLYGAGLRVNEALALRIKDVDLDRHPITVRRGKGAHDRAARRQPPRRDVHPVAHHPKQTLRPSPLRGQPLLQPPFRPRHCGFAHGGGRATVGTADFVGRHRQRLLRQSVSCAPSPAR